MSEKLTVAALLERNKYEAFRTKILTISLHSIREFAQTYGGMPFFEELGAMGLEPPHILIRQFPL